MDPLVPYHMTFLTEPHIAKNTSKLFIRVSPLVLGKQRIMPEDFRALITPQ